MLAKYKTITQSACVQRGLLTLAALLFFVSASLAAPQSAQSIGSSHGVLYRIKPVEPLLGDGNAYAEVFRTITSAERNYLEVGLQKTDGATKIEKMAESLSPGHSIKLGTIPADVVTYPGENYTFIQWGNTMGYDPIRKRLHFIGKAHGGWPYHRLVYDAYNDQWTSDNSVPTDSAWGHGYDHTVTDPDTGSVYFRLYNTVKFWRMDPDTGVWTQLPSIYRSRGSNVASAMAYWRGRGLVFIDEYNADLYDGFSWRTLIDDPRVTQYHNVAQYNPVLNAIIHGGGNHGREMWRIDADRTMTEIATPPRNFGSASGQGLFVAQANSEKFLGYDKDTNEWFEYDPSVDAWTQLTASNGDGSTEQSGLPPLSSTDVLGAVLPDMGVNLFVQANATSADGEAWLYKPGS